MNRKAFAAIVSVGLLMIVVVSGVFVFEKWYVPFTTKMMTDVEKKMDIDLRILRFDSTGLYIKSSDDVVVDKIIIKNSNVECVYNYNLSIVNNGGLVKDYDFGDINGSNFVKEILSDSYEAYVSSGVAPGDEAGYNYLQFGGSGESLLLGNNLFENIDNGTISMDINTDIVHSGDIINFEGWVWIDINDAGSFSAISDGTGSNVVHSSSGFNDGQWHEVILSWNDSKTYLYVDGTLEDEVDAAESPAFYANNRDWVLGNSYDISWPYQGKIANLRIYDDNLGSNIASDTFSLGSLNLSESSMNLISITGCTLSLKNIYEVCIYTPSGIECEKVIYG